MSISLYIYVACCVRKPLIFVFETSLPLKSLSENDWIHIFPSPSSHHPGSWKLCGRSVKDNLQRRHNLNEKWSGEQDGAGNSVDQGSFYKYQCQAITGWWFQRVFLFFSPKFGEDCNFDEHIFQRGWSSINPTNYIPPGVRIDGAPQLPWVLVYHGPVS